MNNPWLIVFAMALFIVVVASSVGSMIETKDNVMRHDPRTGNTYVIEYRSGVNSFGDTILAKMYSDNVTINDDGIVVGGFYEWKGTNLESLVGNNPYDWIYTDNTTIIPKSDYLMKKYVK
jgi:hypothetical protein